MHVLSVCVAIKTKKRPQLRTKGLGHMHGHAVSWPCPSLSTSTKQSLKVTVSPLVTVSFTLHSEECWKTLCVPWKVNERGNRFASLACNHDALYTSSTIVQWLAKRYAHLQDASCNVCMLLCWPNPNPNPKLLECFTCSKHWNPGMVLIKHVTHAETKHVIHWAHKCLPWHTMALKTKLLHTCMHENPMHMHACMHATSLLSRSLQVAYKGLRVHIVPTKWLGLSPYVCVSINICTFALTITMWGKFPPVSTKVHVIITSQPHEHWTWLCKPKCQPYMVTKTT